MREIKGFVFHKTKIGFLNLVMTGRLNALCSRDKDGGVGGQRGLKWSKFSEIEVRFTDFTDFESPRRGLRECLKPLANPESRKDFGD